MAVRQIQLAKITPPESSGIIPRERLFNVPDAARKSPAIWISGPAGCGKTTLAISYLDSSELTCLWYRFNEGDGDPVTFIYYLGLAAKKKLSMRKTGLSLFTPEYSLSVSTSTSGECREMPRCLLSRSSGHRGTAARLSAAAGM